MVRTQLYLPSEVHKQLRLMSKATAKPMAELVRNFIERGLREQEKPTGVNFLESLLEFGADGGDPDLSVNHDHYLYNVK